MLKIVKGLKEFIKDGISIYTDDKCNEYVRVKMGSEDFCIASCDYVKDGKHKFTYDDAMESLKEDGFTAFDKKQARLYHSCLYEIDSKLKEIDSEPLKDDIYWMLSELSNVSAWTYFGGDEHTNAVYLLKSSLHRVRPIMNL